jgi:hypothetical protein
MLTAVATALSVVAALELAAFAVTRWLKKGCPWIVTPTDLDPHIDRRGLERFVEHGWDAEIGWVRKPNTAHNETAKGGGTVRYHIDETGARVNPGFEDGPPVVLAYGDSYTFSRQVNDNQTWPHRLSLLLGGRVANYGVGNYGLDQALMRLEREFDDHPAPVVLMGFVPETICRVTSIWRHFSEYGNTFAFKPSFVLEDGSEFRLIANPIDDPEKLFRIADMLPWLKERDFFFTRKFNPDMLRFPYLWHLWRSRRRNLPLIAAAFSDRLGGDGKNAFCRVMERNIALTAELYREDTPLDLMVAIVERFAGFVRAKGAVPTVVILPQLYDLKRLRTGDHYYVPFLKRLAGTCAVADLGPMFAEDDDDANNYIDDRYGGHLSAAGNEKVARRLAEDLGLLVENAHASEPDKGEIS